MSFVTIWPLQTTMSETFQSQIYTFIFYAGLSEIKYDLMEGLGLVSGSSGPGWNPGREHYVMFLSRHSTLTEFLCTQVYKLETAIQSISVTRV